MSAPSASVGLMVDPGLSRRTALAIADDLRHDLEQHIDAATNWSIDVSDETLPLTADGDIALMDRAAELRERHEWDYIVYLTELPRYQRRKPLLCEVSDAQAAALVSLTSLGALGLRRKTRGVLLAVIETMVGGLDRIDLGEQVRSTVRVRGAKQVNTRTRNDTVDVILTGAGSQMRLLSGMVRSNRPGSMLPAMSAAVTAAVATGAFGIYYGSIWNLSEALSPTRHLMIGAVVMCALSSWLIYRNGLWNRASARMHPWRSGLDNITTIIMVTTSVVLMYLLVATVLFCVSLAVIDASYLEAEIGRTVSLADYAWLSWLSASLGAMAGALGSNFDSNEQIRAATFSKREWEWRKLDRDAWPNAD